MTADDARRVLNLAPGCSADEVRRAYLDLVKVWHPDRFQSDPTLGARAERALRQINQAYDVLRRGTNPSDGSRPSASPGARSTSSSPPLAPVIARAAALGLCVGAVVTLVIWWPGSSQPAPQAPLETVAVATLPREDPARPLSGSEVMSAGRKGQGTIVLQNAGQLDAVAVLASGDQIVRAFYVRGGEQVTALDIAPGTYRIRLMTGRLWMIDRFTANQGYEEVIQPTTFAQVRSREGTERTRVTLAFGTMDGTTYLRRTDPFSLPRQ